MVTEGTVDKQLTNTSKREEYAQLTMDSSCKELCSCLFVRQSNNKRYKRLKEQQHNAFLVGDDKYTEKMI